MKRFASHLRLSRQNQHRLIPDAQKLCDRHEQAASQLSSHAYDRYQQSSSKLFLAHRSNWNPSY